MVICHKGIVTLDACSYPKDIIEQKRQDRHRQKPMTRDRNVQNWFQHGFVLVHGHQQEHLDHPEQDTVVNFSPVYCDRTGHGVHMTACMTFIPEISKEGEDQQ